MRAWWQLFGPTYVPAGTDPDGDVVVSVAGFPLGFVAYLTADEIYQSFPRQCICPVVRKVARFHSPGTARSVSPSARPKADLLRLTTALTNSGHAE
jgi:hypothetical protein